MPLVVHAQAVDPNLKKDAKNAQQHPGKPAPQVVHAPPTHTQQIHTVQGNSTGVSHAKTFNNVNTTQKVQSNVVQSTNGTQFHKTHSNTANQQAVTQQNVQSGNTHGHSHNAGTVQNQAQFTPQGNRSNHYGGQWVDASVHADWGNSGEHYWHHHHYRWYDGGWIIFNPGYAGGGSIPSAVQQSLSQQGYYNGPIDGDIGPGSSSAIANYQSDHGLTPTGQINDPLLQSLGLE